MPTKWPKQSRIWASAVLALVLAPSCRQANDAAPRDSIALIPVQTLHGSGDTVDLLGYANVHRSSSNWLLVRVATTSGHLALYDSTGTARRIFLPTGQGPGEISGTRSQPNFAGVGFGPGDSILVGDRLGRTTRILVFSPPPAAAFVRSFDVPGLGSFSANEFGLLTPTVFTTPRYFPELAKSNRPPRIWVGEPPRGVRWDGSEYARFGALQMDPEERDFFGAAAQVDSAHIWLSTYRKYSIALVAADGHVVRTITRDVPWFPVDTAKPDFPWVKRPPTRIIGLSATDSVLWVLISRASKDWDNRRPKNPPVVKPGMPIQMMPGYARTDLFEFVLEAFDARSGAFLASMDLPGDFSDFTRTRELTEHVEDSTGVVSLRIWRPTLAAR